MGIFAEATRLHAIYDVELQFRHLVMGGVPADPKVIEAWLRTKLGKELFGRDEEMRLMMIRTLQEQGIEGIGPDDTLERVLKASEALAKQKSTVGFKRDRLGVYLEARQVQAMIRENVNILFSDQRWGPTGKSPKGMVVEHVSFPSEKVRIFHVTGAEDYEQDELWQLRDPELTPVLEQDGVELMIGHVDGAAGKRSTLTYHQYVYRPRIKFRMLVIRDRFPLSIWEQIWTAAEGNGLGAVRSQLYGTFDTVRFEKVRDAAEQKRSPMVYISKADQKKLEKEAAEAVETAEAITSTTGGVNGHGEPGEAETASPVLVG